MGADDQAPSESMYDRFVRAARIDADNWRDPAHDLDAIQLATSEERKDIERFLITRGVQHFIDAEALASLDTPRARQALIEAFRNGTTEIRAAVAHVAPDLIETDERLDELIQRIGECDAYNALGLTVAQIEETHPPVVIDAMLRRIASDPGAAAVHFAGLLLYLHGQADARFDWQQRPFLLRFNAGDDRDRREAFDDLCRRIGWDSASYASRWSDS
ncbi:MAG: hypothetical protein KF813_06025 [Trueperaceae bacterium]|nr:hypothetical protein [Trueperaceae bacterium]